MKTILNKAQQAEFLANNWRIAELEVTCSRSGVVKLLDARGEAIAKAVGGGYDKVGAVLADFIKVYFAAELQKLAKSKHSQRFYGLSMYSGKACLNGACGDSCMVKVINAIGFNVKSAMQGRILLLSPITGSGTYAEQAIRKIGAQK